MIDWPSLQIAIVGGDEREREIARLAAATAARVRAFAVPWPREGIAGVVRAPSASAALSSAQYALFPIPGIADDGSLYAPAHPELIVPDARLLAHMAPAGAIILGVADQRLRAAAAARGLTLLEYEGDRELMLRRAPAIVEGAIRVAIEHTEVTIHASAAVVVGHGTIGALLARTLRALGAEVSVAARNAVQRAEAYAAGARPLELSALASQAPRFGMLFSTVPAPVVGREVLARLPAGALVMDLAAPPGSVNLELARELGHRAVWARGLGRRAPVTVGASQWAGIRKRIEQHQAERLSR